jgi:hypothetical protein
MKAEPDTVAGSSILDELRKSCKELLMERGVHDLCCYDIKQDGNWFIIEGWVDSQTTKCHIFAKVPEFEGARWIVDRIRIGAPNKQ